MNLKAFVFSHYKFNIYKNPLCDSSNDSIGDVDIQRIDNISKFKALLTSGYDFTGLPMSINDCFNRLHTGATMFCAFVAKELAHISWLGKERSSFYPFPVTSDEVCIGGTETIEKYRCMGVSTAVHYTMFAHALRIGRKCAILAVHVGNTAAMNAQNKLGSKMCATIHTVNILHLLKFEWVDTL